MRKIRSNVRKLWDHPQRDIIALWATVLVVSGYVTEVSIRESNCDRVFHAALIARSAATERADELAGEQDMAQLSWLQELSNPPADAVGDAHNRIVWLEGTIRNEEARVRQLIDARNQAIEDRKEHPYPELTC